MIVPPLLLGVPLYPLFVALAIAVGVAVMRHGARGEAGAPPLSLLIAAAAAGLLGAKLHSIAERDGAAWWAPAWELGNGYRYPGGLAAGLAVAAMAGPRWWRRGGERGDRLGDLLAPAIAAAMLVVRIGCHLCGCCHGTPTRLPWAVVFPAHSPAWRAHLERGWIAAMAPGSLAVHPLQLYFAAAAALTLAVLLRLRRGAVSGLVLPTFLLVDGAAKWALEWLRLDYRADLQFAAALQALLAVAWFLSRRARSPAQVWIRS